jgi:ABC-type Zn uptake system ZnuABC Zn-binding protein ZnuA
MVKGPIDLVVDVVAVRHRRMAARRIVAFGTVDRSAYGRQPPVDLEAMLVDVGPMRGVKVTVVEIIGVVSMLDLDVAATRAVPVRVLPMFDAGHSTVSSPHGPPSGRSRQPSRSAPPFRGLILLGVAMAGCSLLVSSGCAPARSGRVIAGTIAPISSLLEDIAGPSWEVRTIVPAGSSPHLFEPVPRDVRRLSGARLVVTVGGGYDDWATKLAAAASSSAVLLDAGAAVGIGHADEPKQTSDSEGGHGGHGSHGDDDDPHWWLSPALAERAADPIADALGRLDPTGKTGYLERAAETRRRLEQLDRDLFEALAPFRGRAFLAAHPAWPHFVKRYGLRLAGSIEPAPGREPSPRQLKALVDDARKGGFTVLFTEPQFSESAARTLAADAGLEIGLLDPIGGVPGRKSYFEMMRFNLDALTKTFRRRAG